MQVKPFLSLPFTFSYWLSPFHRTYEYNRHWRPERLHSRVRFTWSQVAQCRASANQVWQQRMSLGLTFAHLLKKLYILATIARKHGRMVLVKRQRSTFIHQTRTSNRMLSFGVSASTLSKPTVTSPCFQATNGIWYNKHWDECLILMIRYIYIARPLCYPIKARGRTLLFFWITKARKCPQQSNHFSHTLGMDHGMHACVCVGVKKSDLTWC